MDTALLVAQILLAFLIGSIALGSSNDPVLQATEDRVPSPAQPEAGRAIGYGSA